MNKTDLIELIAQAGSISKNSAGEVMDAIINGITGALSKGETVTILGFGTFDVRERKARTGRNPKTGETIQIKASKAPGFKPGKSFKDALQK